MNVREIKLGSNNCYLIDTGGKYALVDTGYDHDWDLFLKRLSEAGVSLSSVSHLVLTHHHDDHCGLVNRVLEANKDIRVVMSSRARDLLAEGYNDRAHGAAWVTRRARLLISLIGTLDKQFGSHWKTHSFPPYKTRESDVLVQGETSLRDIGIGLDGRIVETPGHTVDSISVVLDDGDCFVGDAAANLPSAAGLKHCVILVEDIDEYYRTWQKLMSLGARRIFPAHGEPFDAARLSQDLGKIRRRDLVPAS